MRMKRVADEDEETADEDEETRDEDEETVQMKMKRR